MSRTFKFGLLLTGVVFSAVVVNNCASRTTTTASAADAIPTEIDYNWHVRPILSENCFACHGPDGGARKASLRLDLRDAALAELKETPGKYAIVPGDPDASEIVRRITSTDPDFRMPPKEKHKVLSEREIGILRKWIEDGAEYKRHWAFIAPAKPRAPWPGFGTHAINEIDRFILDRLDEEGLALSPEADRETLINRVSLTLTGLPPTLEEIDAFVKDTSADAYERLIDRLLASPVYGERMAAHWLNVARWAETDGYLDDHGDRFLWPWRDWVISAFNRNMPYDQFVTWQIAGDRLPNATKEQILATAFARVGKRSTENGAIDEEYRIEYALARTEMVGTAFLGLTVGCARCHDHKYDPIRARDYYALSGFFNQIDEPGFYPPGQSGIQAGPTLPWTDRTTEDRITAAAARIRDGETTYRDVRAGVLRQAQAKAVTLARQTPAQIDAAIRTAIAQATDAYYSFDQPIRATAANVPDTFGRGQAPAELVSPFPPRRNLFGGAPAAAVAAQQAAPRQGAGRGRGAAPATASRPAARGRGAAGGGGLFDPTRTRLPGGWDLAQVVVFENAAHPNQRAAVLKPLVKPGIRGNALFFDDVNRGYIQKGVGYYERTRPFSLDLWVYPGAVYEDSTVLNNRDDVNSGGAGYMVNLQANAEKTGNRVRFDLIHSWPYNMVSVLTRRAIPEKQWAHVTVTYDGSSTAAGIVLYLNGARVEVDVERDSLTRAALPNNVNSIFDPYFGVMFGKRQRNATIKDGAIDELRLLNRALTPLEVRNLHAGERAIAADAGARARDLAEVLTETDPRTRGVARQLADAREAHNQIISRTPQVLVLADQPKPRPTFVLDRGLYNKPTGEVQPGGLEQIFPYDPSLPRDRTGLAKWLFDPRNPLTARVTVNHLWQMHFGRGLVESADDFGIQGSIPSHPELLDWLAVELVESGWDLKRMHKQILMSATYRQSSATTPELQEKDPQNRLLARGPRFRLPAEFVRDVTLAQSGLLVPKIGGPSVFPYQPAGVWEEVLSFRRWPTPEEVPAEHHHRRSIYTFVKRNAPVPSMAVFDLPERSHSVVRTRTSNTPLQALVMLNDPQFVEAYRHMAARAMRATTDRDGQLRMVFRLATRRAPSDAELQTMRQQWAAEAQRFAGEEGAPESYLSTGVTPVDPKLDPVQWAALTSVTATVMNTPDAYSIR